MFLDPPDNLLKPTRQEADDLAERIREWGEHPDTISALRASSDETLLWLKNNRVPEAWIEPDRSYSELPDPNKGKQSEFIQWWPTPKNLKDQFLTESRQVLLRQRAYDVGLLYFLKSLVGAGRIEIVNNDVVDEILLASSYFGFNQLLAFSRLKTCDPEAYEQLRLRTRKNKVSLNAVAELFGIRSEHRARLFRKKFVRFGSVGMLGASKGHGDGRDIELGPTGVAFYVNVYVPIINHMPLQHG